MSQHGDGHRGSLFNRPVASLIGLQMLSGMVVAPCVALFPVYLNELGFTAVLISTVFTIRRIAGLAASVGGGVLADRLGRKPTLLIGQIGFFTAAFVFLSVRPVPLAILWGLSGAGLGLMSLSGESYLIDHANERHLGVLSALYYWGHTLGSTMSNTATGFALGAIGYSGLGMILAATGGLTVVLCLLLLPNPGLSSGERADRSKPGRKPVSYWTVVRRPVILTLGLVRFLPTFSYGMQTVFVPLLLKNAGAAPQTVAFYAAVSSVAASLAQLATGRAADRFSPKAPGLAAFVFVVVCPLVVAWQSDHLAVVFGLGVLALAAAWSLSTLMAPLVSRVTEPFERGRVLGLMHLFWNCGMILGAMLGGLLFQIAPPTPFLVAGVLNIPSIFLLLLFFRLADGQSGSS